MRVRAVWLVTLAGCSSGDPDPAPVTPPPVAPRDAGVIGKTEIGTAIGLEGDPRRDHLPKDPTRKHVSRPIEIMLKSTPDRAMAAVDGIQLGLTPVYWFGEVDGREHEFTFVKPNYALGRHRFVPVQSGVVHATLVPVIEEPPDAGVSSSPAPVVTPPLPPSTPDAAPPPPPPTPPPTTPAPTAPVDAG